MFIQREQNESIKDLTSNRGIKEQVENILSTLATNSVEDMRNAFRQAIRENPLDPTHRMIYADFLEEHGEPTKAALHRAIASDPHMMENIRHPMQYEFDPSLRLDRNDNWRHATPRQTSASAHRFSLRLTRHVGVKTSTEARKLAAAANRFAKNGDSKQAAEHHYLAAIKHLQAAREIPTKGVVDRGSQANLQANLGYLREGHQQIPPESQQALDATARANELKGSEANYQASNIHHLASIVHRRLARETGNPTHTHTAYTHEELRDQHAYLAQHAADQHRNAAYAHIIAARVHEEQ